MSSEATWDTVVSKKLLSTLYNFREVSRAEVPPTMAGAGGVPDSLFTARTATASTKRLQEVVGRNKTTWWTTWPPENLHVLAEDLGLLREVARRDDWGTLSKAWRSALVPPGIVLQHVQRGRFYSFGCLQHSLLLWPLEQVRVSGITALVLRKLDTANELWITPVTSYEDWEGIPTAFWSPLHFFVAVGKPPSALPATALCQTGRARPLLTYAAECGFWTCRLPLLRRLQREELGITSEEPAEGAEAHVVLETVKAQLKCSDEDACQILEQRLLPADADETSLLLKHADAEECFVDSDKKEVSDFIEKASAVDTRVAEVKKVLQLVRQKARAARVAPAAGSAASSDSRARARKPVRFKSDQASSEASVAKYLPPGPARLAKDEFNGCWRMAYGPHWNKSRSWGKYGGDAACIRILLREVWGHHTSITGEACSVVGLFDD